MPDLSDTANTPETRLALAPQDEAALPAIPEQFSREAQADFLDALAQGGNVRAACAAACRLIFFFLSFFFSFFFFFFFFFFFSSLSFASFFGVAESGVRRAQCRRARRCCSK